jgi:methionine-rich copper-binding protein CopC
MNPNVEAFAQRARQSLSIFMLPKRALIIALVGVLSVGGVVPANSSSSVFYDFNTPGQLLSEFDSYVASGTVQQISAGGIGDSGAINAPDAGTSAVLVSKSKYALAGSGTKYTFTTFFKSTGNGHGGIGFTGLPAAAESLAAKHSRPTDALGISVEGNKFILHAANVDRTVSWSTGASGVTTLKAFSGTNLLTAGNWYKVVLSIEQTSDTLFELIVQVWKANLDGTLPSDDKDSAAFKISGLSNNLLLDAPSISSYISFSGNRITHVDDYSVTLNGSTVVEPEFPVVLTSSVSQAGGAITLTGDVTSDGGATVSERGMVFGTSSGPVISGNKVTVGSETGSFAATTSTLAPGTYFVRAYATNSEGTSYGAESSIEILPPPDVTAPTLASSSPANGDQLVPTTTNITLTFNEDVAVGTGNISIVESDDPGSVILLDVTGGEVTVSGSTVTLNPGTDLAEGTAYHVLIPAGAIKDLADNDFAGISSSTALAFETAGTNLSSRNLPSQPPLVSQARPYIGPTSLRVSESAPSGGVGSATGNNLESIDGVFVDGEETTFVVVDTTTLEFAVPALEPGSYLVKFFIAENGLYLSASTEIVANVAAKEIAITKVNAGSFNGAVALYAKGFTGQRFSAKVGKDWVIVDSLVHDYVRITERTRWIGHPLKVRIYIDRKLMSTIDLVTR